MTSASLGTLFLWLSLAFSCVQSAGSFLPYSRGKRLGEDATRFHFFFQSCAFLLLVYCHFQTDLSLLNVVQHNHSSMPFYYKMAAAWANHEGSLLLWTWTLSLVGWLLLKTTPEERSLTIGIQGLFSILFLTSLLLTSSPFIETSFFVLEGQELNPLLQDKSVTLHPPLLYLGYVGYSGLFSLILGFLFHEKLPMDHIKLWARLPWIFLTLGVTLGSWWAYYELGWGGFWFWDPVENASLLPWLLGAAFLHLIHLKNKYLGITLITGLMIFPLCILGTFLVRSGLVSSVHAFALDSSRSYGLLIVFCFSLIGVAAPFFRSYDRPPLSLFSREGGFLLAGFLFFLAFCFVALGTLAPLVGTTSFTVNAHYYHVTTIPLFLVLLALMGFYPFLPQRLSQIFTPLSLSLGLSLLAWIWLSPQSFVVILGGTLSLWAISTAVPFLKKSRGMALAHLGAGVTALGIVAVVGFSQERVQSMSIGDWLEAGPYRVHLRDVVYDTLPTAKVERALFDAYKGNDFVTTLAPEKRYSETHESLFSETAIYSNGVSDLYLVLGAFKGDNKWQVRGSYFPLAPFIWFGGLLMVLGALLKMLKGLRKKGK